VDLPPDKPPVGIEPTQGNRPPCPLTADAAPLIGRSVPSLITLAPLMKGRVVRIPPSHDRYRLEIGAKMAAYGC
jgi:hypothetical protein